MAQCALTTVDNPYNPFTQYEAWYRFDEGKGYHSCSYLARIARTSDQLSDAENEQELERAIDDIKPCGLKTFLQSNHKHWHTPYVCLLHFVV